MKRFHIHVSVSNLSESIRFYSKMFGGEPTVLKPIGPLPSSVRATDLEAVTPS